MIVNLLKTYLHHDIRQLVYRYADPRMPDREKFADSLLEEFEPSAEQLIQRFCHTGVGYLKSILRRVMVTDHTEADDTLTRDEQWSFTFKQDFADVDGLAKLMHWFIVRYALWQWLLMYSPADAAAAKAELDEIEDALKSYLYDKPMPMKVHRIQPTDTATEIIFTYEP